MTEIVFLLEEPSAKAMLEGLLKRLLAPDTLVRFIVFEGKRDLDGRLKKILRGYRTPGACFVVLRDQDSQDCRELKAQLQQKCTEATQPNTLVRIACREIESWYIADLAAVEKALTVGKLSTLQNRAKYRKPDTLANPAQELEKITEGRYQKVGGSRAIGLHLEIDNTRSRSFAVFVEGIRRLVTR